MPDIKTILDEFLKVFGKIRDLPPQLRHEPVSLCPYRYPHYQKFQIEKNG